MGMILFPSDQRHRRLFVLNHQFFPCVRSTVAAKQQSVNQMEFCARLTAALLLYDSKQFDMYFRYISIQFVLADVFNEMTNSQTRCAQ